MTINKNELTLSDLFLNDSPNRIRDAIANTGHLELLTAYAAINRLQATGHWSSPSTEEMEHYKLQRRLMEEALVVRLRSVPKADLESLCERSETQAPSIWGIL